MTLLESIKDNAQNIAEAIAAVLEMDVTIVDEKLNRIAGTGYFKNKEQVPPQSVFAKALYSGRSFVITHPGEDPQCYSCPDRGRCKEKAEICCPITIEGKVAGIIGIVTFSREKRKIFLAQRNSYINFVEKMANLVAAKALEQQMMEDLISTKKELETTVNYVDMGIVTVNNKLEVTTANDSSRRMLHAEGKNLKLNDFDLVFPEFGLKDVIMRARGYKDRKISFDRGSKHYNFIATARPVCMGDKCSSVVLFFQDSFKLQRSMYRVFRDEKKYTFNDLFGEEEIFKKVISQAKDASKTDSSILITGESGTGKELLARAVHEESPRSGLFVAINCAAIPETLLESELFGYEEGAFTGASKGGKAGMLELAAGGTVFLDEIGDMPLYLQAKLLRVIQDRKIFRLGGKELLHLDIRLIAATNKDLAELINRGQFRQDLYYRINVIPLSLPPLRKRKGDIILLARKFLDKHNAINGKEVQGIDKEVEDYFLAYNWPGNVRELENIIEYGVNFEKEQYISYKTLAPRLSSSSIGFKEGKEGKEGTLKELTEDFQRQVINHYLKKYGDTLEAKEAIARKLNISISTLYRRL